MNRESACETGWGTNLHVIGVPSPGIGKMNSGHKNFKDDK